MSDYDDRGAYTPPSDRLAFDARTPVRGGGPAPVTLIVSGVVLVGLVGGVFFLYRDGFKHRSEAPALVGAPVADARTPATPPPAADNASLVVDKSTTPPPAPAFAPPPAQALPAQALPAPPSQMAAAPPAAAAPSTPVVASASPPVAGKPAAPQVVRLVPDAPPKAAAAPPKQVAAATPQHVAASATLRQTAAAEPAEHPVVRHQTMTIASLTDDALAHHARAARASRDDSATREDGATRQVREPNVRYIDAPPPAHRSSVRYIDAPPPAAPPARRTVVAARIKGSQYAGAAYAPVAPVRAAPARAAAGPGSGWVQIGAFSSPSLADQGWRDIAHLAPGAMAGKGKMVQPVDRDDGTTLYRTYVTGFASVSAAQSFCAELRASGKACMVK
jgi:hypothetical protein